VNKFDQARAEEMAYHENFYREVELFQHLDLVRRPNIVVGTFVTRLMPFLQ